MDGALIIGGEKVVLPGQKVATWHDHHMTFEPSQAPRRTEEIRWCVLHWTGAERRGELGAAQVHRTLQSRGLSVEFVITNDGRIWQFFDPLRRQGKHTSRVNKFSVGVEVAGRGFANRQSRPLKGESLNREVYEGKIHGWTTQMLAYLPEQQRSVEALAEGLCEGLGLPRHVEGAPFDRRSNLYLRNNSGFSGHMHCAWLKKKSPKCDPGPRPLELLAEHLGQPGQSGISL